MREQGIQIKGEIKSDQSTNNLIDSLKVIYDDVIEIDTVTGDTIVWCNKQQPSLIRKIVDYQKLMDFFAEEIVYQLDRKFFSSQTKLQQTRKFMEQKEEHISFLTRYLVDGPDAFHWYKIHLLKAGEQKAFMFADNVHDALQEEWRQKELVVEANEVAVQASKVKAEFLSRMSHDARTPLNSIVGLTAIAGAHLDEPEMIMDCLNQIHRASNQLLNLVEEVIEVSKLENGETSEQSQDIFCLTDVYESFLRDIKPEAEKRNIMILPILRKIDHNVVVGNPIQLVRGWQTLAMNAVTYTPEGGRIRIELKEEAEYHQDFHAYSLVVEDNGIGIPEEFVDKIFEPFERLPGVSQGNGLGMTIARQIFREMNGDVEVVSKIGKGTKVISTFYLKAERQRDFPADEYRGKRVLLFGKANTAIEWALNEIGFVVTIVNKIDEVMSNEKKGYSYLFVAAEIGAMEGIKVLATLQRMHCKIPMIFVADYSWTGMEYEGLEAGAEVVVCEPVSSYKIYAKLKELKGFTFEQVLKNDPPINLCGKKVLVVEDHPVNREVLSRILKEIGIQVQEAKSGNEALDLLQNSEEAEMDAVFMDIKMKGMDGYETTRQIRKMTREDLSDIPVFAMTADVFEEDVHRAMQAGMNEYLTKPIQIDRLYDVVRKWII